MGNRNWRAVKLESTKPLPAAALACCRGAGTGRHPTAQYWGGIGAAKAFTPGSGLITRRGRWRPGGWQNGRHGRSGRSRLQDAASPSVRKRASRFCDPCATASCCNGPVSCGSDGAGCKAGCPAGPASYGFCPCRILYPQSPRPQAAGPCVAYQPGEVTTLPLTQVESPGNTLIWSLLVMPPLVPPIRRGHPPC